MKLVDVLDTKLKLLVNKNFKLGNLLDTSIGVNIGRVSCNKNKQMNL